MTVIGFPNTPPLKGTAEKWEKPKTLEDWPWDKDLGKPYGDINAANTTEALLTKRSKTHGDYAVKASIIQSIKQVMRAQDNWYDVLNDEQRESLDMIAHKIGRILSGDPNVTDHWADIAGYATLPIRESNDVGC